ncbi:MAG: peptidylprolyl isomerase [Myxococcales bacterium]|nr:peptidylprolyl isomerase [Myxococcales bacterium]
MRRSLTPLLALALALACSSGDAPKTDAGKAEAEPAKAAEPAPEAAPPAPVQAADPNEACAKILVVAHSELAEVPEGVTRDKAAARERADALLARLKKGEGFAELAAESDDAKTKAKRGAMGTIMRDAWPERFAAILEPTFALGIGDRSEVLDTPLGFAIVERCPIDKVHTRHILIRYAGAKNADEDVKRSRDEARGLATEIRGEIAGGKDFAEVAREKGEDGTAERGGDLGPVGRGMFAVAYEDAAWALAPGALSEVVETDFGFHVIQRMADGT